MRLRRFLPAMAAALLAAAPAAVAEMTRDASLNLNVTGSSTAENEAVAAWVRQSQELLDTVTRQEPSRPTVTLNVIIGGKPPAAPRPPTVHLPAEATLAEILHRLNAGVILRRQLELQPRDPAGPPSSAEWLAAAMTRRFLGTLSGDASPVSMLVPASAAEGRLPDLDAFTRQPVAPEWTIPYTLYSRYADLLLTLLQFNDGSRDRRVQRILELQAAGRPPLQAMQLALADRMPSGETLQDWARRESSKLFRLQRRTQRSALIRERLQELLSIAVVTPGRTGTYGWERMQISRLPEMTAAGAPGVAATRVNLQRQLGELAREAPPLLQPPLRLFAEALQNLREGGDEDKLRRSLSKAQADFEAAAVMQDKLDQYLDGLERETGNRSVRCLELLQPLAVRRNIQLRGLDPEIQDWLDSLDR